MTQPTTLYRLYDAAGALLYVGIAGNPGRRFEQHASEKPWWGLVASVELEHFPTRSDATTAERVTIQAEHPTHNIVHRLPARAGTARAAPRGNEAPRSALTYRERYERYMDWAVTGSAGMRRGRCPAEADTPDDEWAAVVAHGLAVFRRRRAAFTDTQVPVIVRLHSGPPGYNGTDHLIDGSERTALWRSGQAWITPDYPTTPRRWSTQWQDFDGKIERNQPWGWDESDERQPVTVWVDGEFMYPTTWDGRPDGVCGRCPWWADLETLMKSRESLRRIGVDPDNWVRFIDGDRDVDITPTLAG